MPYVGPQRDGHNLVHLAMAQLKINSARMFTVLCRNTVIRRLGPEGPRMYAVRKLVAVLAVSLTLVGTAGCGSIAAKPHPVTTVSTASAPANTTIAMAPTTTVAPTTTATVPPATTTAPITAAPVTAPPVTAPPVTAPRVTAPPVTAPPATTPNCPNGSYTNSLGNVVCSPYQSPSGAPAGATPFVAAYKPTPLSSTHAPCAPTVAPKLP